MGALYLQSCASRSSAGPAWRPSPDYSSGFVVRLGLTPGLGLLAEGQGQLRAGALEPLVAAAACTLWRSTVLPAQQLALAGV